MNVAILYPVSLMYFGIYSCVSSQWKLAFTMAIGKILVLATEQNQIQLKLQFHYRLFHSRHFYKSFHKIHHEWTAPVGITSIYSHPLEHFFVNIGPLVLGPVVTGCHLSTAWLWYSLYIISSTISHGGFHLPFLPSPEAHDFHHSK